MKQLQWRFGSTMSCHGAIGLWRRDVLGKKILWDHDTVFHGEDMYMGLMLHRMRKNYTIMVSVPVPDSDARSLVFAVCDDLLRLAVMPSVKCLRSCL